MGEYCDVCTSHTFLRNIELVSNADTPSRAVQTTSLVVTLRRSSAYCLSTSNFGALKATADDQGMGHNADLNGGAGAEGSALE